MTKKQVLNFDELAFCEKQAKKRYKFLILAFFLLVAATFLILLLKPINLYVVLLDVSESMSQVMDSADGRTKMDVAKESIIKFVETGGAKDYFVIATFGKGDCKGQGLEWIEANPDKCGGEIVSNISSDKLQLYDSISNIQALKAETHLSEGLFKVFTYLEKSLPGSLISKRIEVLIVGDGQDHCKAIEAGKNVILLPWSFFDKLRVSTIAVQVGDGDLENLQTLAADGNGEFVDVYAADEFYEKIRIIFPKGPAWILYIHIALAVIFLLLFLLILRV
jgi:hypothetical protein